MGALRQPPPRFGVPLKGGPSVLLGAAGDDALPDDTTCSTFDEGEMDEEESVFGVKVSLRFSTTNSSNDSPSREVLRMEGLSEHFRLQRLLGAGGFGRVYEAVALADGKRVAVKTVQTKTGRSRADVEAEIEILSEFDHPHIMRLHNYFHESDGSRYALVMDLCAGGSLLDQVSRYVLNATKSHASFCSGLPPKPATRYLWQMLSGLGYLHHHGFVHRDVKLDNYMLSDATSRSVLKLGDFGLAARIRPGEKLTRRCGTLRYQAPEVALHSYDHGVDVWSFGVTAFVMCTGRFPFGGSLNHKLDIDAYCRRAQAGDVFSCDLAWKPHAQRTRAFVMSALVVDAAQRPTCRQLLSDHPWIRIAARPGEAGEASRCQMS